MALSGSRFPHCSPGHAFSGRTSVLVVVVSANDGPWLRECLASLWKSEFADYSVLVIDNASTDETRTVIRENADERLRCVTLASFCSFADASNIGLRQALEQGLPYVLLLNSDTRVHPRALVCLHDFLESHPAYGIVGAHQVEYTGDDWTESNEWTRDVLRQAESQGRRSRRIGDWTVIDHDYVQGAALFVRTTLLRSIGLLDPVYGTFYEETDLCRRCLLAGARVGLVMESLIKHYGGGNWRESRRRRSRRDRLYLRNQLLYEMAARGSVLSAVRSVLPLVRTQLGEVRRRTQHLQSSLWHYPLVLGGLLPRLRWLPRLHARNRLIAAAMPLSSQYMAIGREHPESTRCVPTLTVSCSIRSEA